MNRLIARIFLLSLMSLSPFLRGFSKESETINYVVSYKWGLIQKDAGTATIQKTPTEDGYELFLTAATKPWADKIYKMRDTLISVTDREHYLPKKYTRLAHEKGKFSRDEITFDHSTELTKGSGVKHREKNGEIKKIDVSLEGNPPAYDFLSVFFHLRDIDYASMQPGEIIETSIFSGDQVETLKVRPVGIETVKMKDKSEREAWHIVFNFTTKGGSKSSDDIDCWISNDEDRLPVLIVGSLPVGKIRCNYVSEL